MVKQRMTALDVRATVEEMRASLIGLRLLNLYNISNKMFLFKFGQGENKRSVLLENGVRFHLTELAREKPKVPSQFTLKLRKHIRAWRLDSITQLQHDRTIDLCFGVASTEGCFHIIIELFSKGNVILTDHTYKMMMLLRTHRDDAGMNLAVNETYPLTAPFTGGPAGSATASVSASTMMEEQPHVMLYTPTVDAAGRLQVCRIADADLSPAQRLLKQERVRVLKAEWELGLSRSNERTMVQALVAGIQHFGPDIAQHVLTISGVANAQQKNWTDSPEELLARLLEGLLEAFDLAKVDLTSAGGYLIRKATKTSATPTAMSGDAAAAAAASSPGSAPATESSAAVMVAVAEQYESFTPILLAQYTQEGVEALHRPSFGRVCDEFFLITETERIDASNDKRKSAAKGKEDKFALDHARRIHGLESDIAKNEQKGEQLILNAERVDEAIQLINGALATGISWDALKSLLKRRNAEGHPVAYMIHELFLERNAISVMLEATLEDEEDDCDVPPLVVEVALSKTAHANAADYFGKRKQHRSKLERTVASTDKAAAGAARKGAKKAAERKEKKVIVKERQRNWWEKFFWFRTSAGDLVLRGKDVQSTELLLRRVKTLGDVFVQCEVDGSLPCLLRPMGSLWRSGAAGPSSASPAASAAGAAQPVAAASLCEAGAWCVAFSGAWESKQSTGAWWIYASQVTGGSATGVYIFSGERHYLPPQPMSLGSALLFYVTRTVDQTPPTAAEAAAAAAALVEAPDAATAETAEEEEQEAGDEDQEAAAVAEVDMLQRELPRLPTEALLKAAATDVTDVDTASGDIIPADPATELTEMPTIEALRADQRRQHQTYGGNASSGGKAKKGGYARNSRVDRDGLQGGPAGAVSVVPSTDAEVQSVVAAAAATSTTTTATTTQQQQGKALSKHQKKKLKKIQDKYGDQDEEDRVLGAQVNGNQLSRVQLLELEQRVAQRQQAEAAKRVEAKAGRKAAREAGTLRYRAVGEGSEDVSSDDEDEDEEEVVSDFTEEENEGNGNDRDDAGSGVSAANIESPPPPLSATDDLAGDSEKEEVTTAAASPTSATTDDDENEEEGSSASQLRGGAARSITTTTGVASSRDREAAVAQQAMELHRAFPHYTMRPAPTDTVHHVVAVCAPMMVVNEYAYHTTLAMGNAKKGALAAKLLQVFTERAERGSGGVGASMVGTGGMSSRKTAKKSGKAHADPSKPAAAAMRESGGAGGGGGGVSASAAVNPSVVQALRMTSPNDIVEQLRANVKPVEFKV